MNYHKIKNVDMSVCTCEQKIAYNYATTYAIKYRDTWRNTASKYFEFQRSDFIHDAVQWCMKLLMNNSEIMKKYDVDAIQATLNTGMRNYFESDRTILSSYEDIGRMFPADYL